MGMYTELILGCELKEETPKEIIEAIKDLLGNDQGKVEKAKNQIGLTRNPIVGASYYFGVSSSQSYFKVEPYANAYVLSTRSNIKNYSGDIETFLEWLEPHIESGSGFREIYAIVICEKSSEPVLYCLE